MTNSKPDALTSNSLAECSPVVARRMTGESYADIGKAFGYSIQKVRYLCKQAMIRGEVTAEQIYYRPQERTSLPVGEYELRWFLRVLSNVKVINDCCSLLLRDANDEDVTLIEKRFEGNSFSAVSQQVEAWAQEQYERAIQVLRAAFEESHG